MQTSKEIRSNLNNIKYYVNKLEELIKLQVEKDVETGHKLGINTEAGSKRFNSLGIMQGAAGWIGVYCDNFEANLKIAETQDKELQMFGEEAITPGKFE